MNIIYAYYTDTPNLFEIEELGYMVNITKEELFNYAEYEDASFHDRYIQFEYDLWLALKE